MDRLNGFTEVLFAMPAARHRPLPPVASPNNNHVSDPRRPPPPPPPQAHIDNPPAWSTGLFYCCSDVSNCCITCFCPCVTFGHIAEIIDKGSISCRVSAILYTVMTCGTACVCCCIYSCIYRSRMRKQYNLPAYPCRDCLVHLCCEPCALCQEYRELKNRGFNMSTGWQRNAEQQNRQVIVAPVLPQEMGR